MGRMMRAHLTFTFIVWLVLMQAIDLSDAKRTWSGGSSRKTGGGSTSRSYPSSNTHVTKPTYNTNSGNSHTDLTRLSYPNYNSQPNRPVSTGGNTGGNPPIGWNVPHQQGPPPAYSASNTVGGAKTNLYESPPAYKPNNAAPPSYSAGNVHTPITATNTHGVQSSYPGQTTYHSPGALPPGATYYSGGHVPPGASYYPSGHVPAGASYYPGGGHMPAGGSYYPSPGGVPPGATYLPAGAALPAGATYYSSPPQQSSSGLGFGSGLAAGVLSGALLGHALTPTQTRVESVPANSGGGGSGDPKVIIINNGQPGQVQEVNGTTMITTNAGVASSADAPGANTPLAPMAPVAPMPPMAPMPAGNGTDGAPIAPPPEQPAPGGIICVPVRVNETDPADSTKMIEVEKVACYPAPPPPPPPGQVMGANATVPLAPMNEVSSPIEKQQLQQDHAMMKAENGANAVTFKNVPMLALSLFGSSMLSALIAYASGSGHC